MGRNNPLEASSLSAQAIMKFNSADTGTARKQFIVRVAHQLSGPLVPIRNAAALLRRDSVDATTVRQAAELIERQASGMNRLIGDLLDVSHAELGGMELRRTRASLAELMERALESTGPEASARGHVLSVSVPPQPIYLSVDVARMAKALSNVIDNAVRYTLSDGYIRVRAERNEAQVVISVSDTGMGIPAEELESIFGLFAHVGAAARAEAGLGLGLYLARHLIEAHGGNITAASKGPRQGSEFTIRLPCETSTALIAEPSDAERAAGLSPA